jgi:hypothetical protein
MSFTDATFSVKHDIPQPFSRDTTLRKSDASLSRPHCQSAMQHVKIATENQTILN